MRKLTDDGFPKMPGDWLFKVVPWIIGFGFVVVVACWIGYGVLIYKGANALKGCQPALIQKTDNGQTTTTIGCAK